MTRSCLRRSCVAGLVLACLSGCTLDSFLFSPERVDAYHWDEADPNLDGELTDAHPSLVPDAERSEGFLDVDGARVHWVFAHQEAPRAAVLYSHGTSKDIGRYWDRVERMWQHGYAVLIYDYPGYGRSTGTPNESNIDDSARAALELLVTLPDVDASRIVLYGYSLGSGPTYELAALAARNEVQPVGAVISESAFCSVAALVQDGSFLNLAPSFFADSRFDNCARIAELEVPVLLIHGLSDDFVVPRNAHLLEAAARHPPQTFFVPGANHTDIPLVAGAAYDDKIDAFVDQALGTP